MVIPVLELGRDQPPPGGGCTRNYARHRGLDSAHCFFVLRRMCRIGAVCWKRTQENMNEIAFWRLCSMRQ
jgi:hypothetical protein